MPTFLRPYPPDGKASLSPCAARKAEQEFGDFPEPGATAPLPVSG